MAGDPDNIQPSFMVVSKEKISFANHSYFWTYTTWSWYGCISRALNARHANTIGSRCGHDRCVPQRDIHTESNYWARTVTQKGLGKQRTAWLIELEPSQKKETTAQSIDAMPPSKEAPSGDVHVKQPSSQPLTLMDIRKPTIDDYVNVPSDYVPGRPMLQWTMLDKIQWPIKRFHDWYMRAVHAYQQTCLLLVTKKQGICYLWGHALVIEL